MRWILFAQLMLVSTLSFAHNGKDHTLPQRKKVCQGKSAGEVCEFKTHQGAVVQGTCEAKPPKALLLCVATAKEAEAQ